MTIPGSILGSWAHHGPSKASVQAHTSIRQQLEGLSVHDVFLQGSYKNDTNISRASDVDVVVVDDSRLQARLVEVRGDALTQDASHKAAHNRWQTFRHEVRERLRSSYGSKAVKQGRKSIKIAKGQLHADADVVPTLRYGEGIAFYLGDERRWVASYPKQHHAKGIKKQKATGDRYKRTIRMFKAARNHLLRQRVISEGLTSSYFIECLIYNVPNQLFKPRIGPTYKAIADWLSTANMKKFSCQNEIVPLFGPSKEQWDIGNAKSFVKALTNLWNDWPPS